MRPAAILPAVILPAAILLTALTLTACTAAPSSGPAGQASTTDRNPISGNRGGSGSM